MANRKKKNRSKKNLFLILSITILALFLILFYYYANEPLTITTSDGTPVLELTPKNLSKTSENTTKKNLPEYSNSQCDLDYPENHPLYFGNPSDALSLVSNDTNYLLEKNQFVTSYNNQTLCANWVAWHLCVTDLGQADRSNKFTYDTTLPEQWYHVKQNDYQYNTYGFDRGHLCPSADRTKTQQDNEITFLMTNMVPQAPDNNRIIWKSLEDYERSLALQGYELYIFAGGYGQGGSSAMGDFSYIAVTDKNNIEHKIVVPEFTWKVMLIIPEGDDDINRVGVDSCVIAVWIPNKNGIHKDATWETYKTSVDFIEQKTGIDFFELIEDSIENELEK